MTVVSNISVSQGKYNAFVKTEMFFFEPKLYSVNSILFITFAQDISLTHRWIPLKGPQTEAASSPSSSSSSCPITTSIRTRTGEDPPHSGRTPVEGNYGHILVVPFVEPPVTTPLATCPSISCLVTQISVLYILITDVQH